MKTFIINRDMIRYNDDILIMLHKHPTIQQHEGHVYLLAFIQRHDQSIVLQDPRNDSIQITMLATRKDNLGSRRFGYTHARLKNDIRFSRSCGLTFPPEPTYLDSTGVLPMPHPHGVYVSFGPPRPARQPCLSNFTKLPNQGRYTIVPFLRIQQGTFGSRVWLGRMYFFLSPLPSFPADGDAKAGSAPSPSFP